MRLVRHLSDLPFERLRQGSVVTIGAFDGIHLGHDSCCGGWSMSRDVGSSVRSL